MANDSPAKSLVDIDLASLRVSVSLLPHSSLCHTLLCVAVCRCVSGADGGFSRTLELFVIVLSLFAALLVCGAE